MATQTSGNGHEYGRDHDDQRRPRDRDERFGMRGDHGDRGRGGAENDDERDWRGRGEGRGDDRWRDQQLSSWDRDRGRDFDRYDRGIRGEWERGGSSHEPGRGWADSEWDQRGDQMYSSGASRRDEYLDEGRFEQRPPRPRGFDQRLDRGQSGYGSGQSGMVGRGRGYYGQQGGETYRGDTYRTATGYGAGEPGYSGGHTSAGYPGEDGHDRRGWQSHRGKGPQGYSRSDDRIKEDVCEALTQDHDVDATSVEIQVRGGEVTLNGSVPERRMKRIAEECVEHVSGVKDVQNHLKVQSETDRDRTGSGTSSISEGNKPTGRHS